MQKVDLVRDYETGTYYLHRRSKKGNHLFRNVADGFQWFTRFTEPVLLYKYSDIQFERNYTVMDSEFVSTFGEADKISSRIFIKG
ncbi:hypothetical protein L8C07_05925 [Paenibacillus sp. CMAA1739]|uniref:hypothetical protein n=1 Tax=Paenibacillus ottowii TaxID=2315729 RepID=UPI002DB94525|nr:hypothetical protein [Paenibacillus sp. CMAA1739]MEC4565477.1 hypothetical protein [Paenibacillus sp. CMAA1739]